MKKRVAGGLSMLFAVASANAVIVGSEDGTQNTTAPIGDQGWSHVGRISNKPSSVTYLDNNWFITANHIKQLDNPTGVLLGGSSYSINADSWTRITNSTGSEADLIMFRVQENVGLPALSIASSPSNGTGLTLIGNGHNRETDLTRWRVVGSTWTEVSSGGNRSGYKSDPSGATMRWGLNTKEGDAGIVETPGYGFTDMFYTDFDLGEAQGAIYDSGGGVFVNTESEWELAGIMINVTGETGQPDPRNNHVFGSSLTLIADLSTYSDQINNTIAIPEPSVLVLTIAFSGAALCIRRFFLI